MPKIIILRGLQGSGKTTWAKKWCTENSNERVRFNRDDIRNMLGAYWVPYREKLITAMYWNFMNETMIEQYDIVVDNLNLNEKYVSEIKDYVDEFNRWIENEPHLTPYEVEIKDDFLSTSLEECIQRDSQRPNPVGEQVIRSTYSRYKDIYWKDR